MKTVKISKYLLFTGIVLVLSGCDSMFNPELDNVIGESRTLSDPQTALGFLNSAYVSIPSTYNFSECATDDAVMNDPASSYPRMVGGSWSALFDPLSSWAPTYKAIMNVNQFMTYLPKITISWSSETNDSLYRKRWTGEAYGIRGFLHLQLLQYYAGKDNSGNVLGIPYLKSVLTTDPNVWSGLKRPAFTETVSKIASDLDTAIVYLPMDYSGTTSTVTGLKNKARFTKRIAYASKARLYMHAASPLFNSGNYNTAYCDSAVKYSVLAIGTNSIGTTITPQLFYTTDSPSTTEIIWRMNMITEATSDAAMASTVEAKNYPPSKYGKGQVNPTQEFVDAFPDKNGYPITESTIYNASTPYLNRNARLDTIVIRDGGKINGKVIFTAKSDAINGIENPGATRTGYYLKKLLRPDVSITNPVTGKKNMFPIFRTTEMYLIFAEAQTASKGADVTYMIGTTAKSPRAVIKSIRYRSGIPSADVYATNLAASDFMKLIRNERRIELAFEGFRFADLRRWMLPLNGTVHRARILTAGGTPQILEISEEPRNYSQFMYFAPIPNNEILKCPNIVQNAAQ